MDLRELRYFESTYELESISAAAKHCFVSQPSISSAIQSLEQYLEEDLFLRHARGVTPTDAAHRGCGSGWGIAGAATAAHGALVPRT